MPLYTYTSTEQRQLIATEFFNLMTNTVVAASHKDDKTIYTKAVAQALAHLSSFIQLILTKNKHISDKNILLQELEKLSHDPVFLELLEQEIRNQE
jgi:hypothetical protein